MKIKEAPVIILIEQLTQSEVSSFLFQIVVNSMLQRETGPYHKTLINLTRYDDTLLV